MIVRYLYSFDRSQAMAEVKFSETRDPVSETRDPVSETRDPVLDSPPIVIIPIDFTDYFAFKSYGFNGPTSCLDIKDQKGHFQDLILKTRDKMEKSTVAHKGKTKIDPSARRSKFCSYITICANLTQKSNEFANLEIKKILPKSIQNVSLPLFDNDARYWDLVQYDEGDQFIKHKDGRSSNEYDIHFGTLLLFPPSSYSEFSGGELVFYDTTDVDKIYTIVKPNEFDKWTLVAFPVSVFHECKVITKGTRYVFKSKITFKADYWKFMAVEKSPRPLSITDQCNIKEIADYEQRIINIKGQLIKQQKEIEEKLKQLQTEAAANIKSIELEIEGVKEHVLSDKSKYLLEEIDKTVNNVVIVLDHPYEYNVSETSLIGQDVLLYNEIIKKYPQTKVIHVKAMNKFPEGYEGSIHTEGVTYSLDLSNYEQLSDHGEMTEIEGVAFKILVQADQFAKTAGVEYNIESEWNDEADVPLIYVAAISIIK